MTPYVYHYTEAPTLSDYSTVENLLTIEERSEMNKVLLPFIDSLRHSSLENRLLAEKMFKCGYLFKYMKPMNLNTYPVTDPPEESK